ncbi:MAG: hypothetical protein C0618_05265 [Desulfuromonas sp.]|nr:MAG: hypothetical protein C0618_05265 [Desulfuromonas sp.]
MKRFRITLLVVCLLLGWLGYNDVSVYLRNQTPGVATINQVAAQDISQEWLQITGGYQDLLQAINMSGTMEIDAFLVPLKTTRTAEELLVWYETRNPRIVSALKTYYFKLDTDEARARFIEQNKELFFGQRNITGMTVSNLIADSNKNKLEKLLKEMNIPVSDKVVFVSEGKEPEKIRGFFFVAMAMLGIFKFLLGVKKKAPTAHNG